MRWLVGGTGIAVVGGGISLRYNGFPDTLTHTVFGLGLSLLIGSTALSLERGPRWLEWRPLVRIVELNVGDTQRLTLHDGKEVTVKLTYPYSIKILDWSVKTGNLTVIQKESLE